MERESLYTAVDYLHSNSEDILDHEKCTSPWLLYGPGNNERRKLKPVGLDIPHFYQRFFEQVLDDGIEDARYSEQLPVKAQTKFCVTHQDPTFALVRKSFARAVSQLLLNDTGKKANSLSLWFQIDGRLYGVWPCLALNYSARLAAQELLLTWPGLQGAPGTEFDEWNFSHFDRHLRFPLAISGATFIEVLDEEGNPLDYDERKHKRCYKHLTVNGAFAFSPDYARAQGLALAHGARISNLTDDGCLIKTSGLLNTKVYSGVFQRLIQEKLAQCRRDAEARAQLLGDGNDSDSDEDDDAYARLDWSDGDVFYSEDCVRILKDLIKNRPERNYRAAYEQLNKWFIKAGKGVDAPLYAKSLDTKLLLSDPTARSRFLTIQKVNIKSIEQRLKGVTVDVIDLDEKAKKRQRPIFKQWLEHEHMNTVEEVVTVPCESSTEPIDPYAVKGVFNAWRGWDYYRLGHHTRMETEHGAKSFFELFDQLESVRTICAFIYAVLCDSEEQVFRMFLFILANVLTHPEDPCHKMVYLLGEEGVGKSLFMDALMNRVLGMVHCATFTNAEHMIGHFTGALTGKVFIKLEEVSVEKSDVDAAGRLQQLITGADVMIHAKYGDPHNELNFLTIMGMSNQPYPNHVNESARRYLYATVCDVVVRLTADQKNSFFAPLVELFKGDGLFEFAYWLTRINLSEWMMARHTMVVANHTLAMQKLQSMAARNPVDEWLYACCTSLSLGQIEQTQNVIDPISQRITGQVRTLVSQPWGATYELPLLFSWFKKANPVRSKYVTLDGFIDALVKALKDAKGFDHAPKVAVDLNKKPYKDNVRSVKMPSATAAKYSLELKVGGLGHASGEDHIAEYIRKQKRNKKVADAPVLPTVYSLLPKHSNNTVLYYVLFGDYSTTKIALPFTSLVPTVPPSTPPPPKQDEDTPMMNYIDEPTPVFVQQQQ